MPGEQRGAGVRRVILTTVDQGFSSVSNFAVGVVVARVAGPSGLGAYAVAYSVWLALATVHRSLVTDLMAIEGDARHRRAADLLGAGLSAELVIGGAAAALTALAGIALMPFEHTFGLALLTLAPFITFLLVQDYWRWVGFMKAQPGRALVNDTLFNSVQALALVLFLLVGFRTAEIALVAWGLGAAAGAFFGLSQFHVESVGRGGLKLLSERWHTGKWLTASALTGWGSTQSYPLLAGGILGPSDIGGLRAAQSLVLGPANVLLQAGGSIGLPEASKARDERGWSGLQRVGAAVTAAGVISLAIITLVVFLAGRALLVALYGTEFGRFSTAAELFALGGLVQTFGLGALLTLKTTRQTRTLFNISVVIFIVSATSVVVYSLVLGVNGAALATILTAGTQVIGLRLAHRRTARSFEGAPTVAVAPSVPIDLRRAESRREPAPIAWRAAGVIPTDTEVTT